MNDYVQLTGRSLPGQTGVILILVGIILLICFSALFYLFTDEALTSFGWGILVVGVIVMAFFVVWSNSRDYDANVTKFEESYGVSVSSFVPKGGNDRELSDKLKAATEGSNEYIYSYHGDHQTVTINIDRESRLRMFDDDGAVIPSNHKRAERLLGDKKNDAKAKDKAKDKESGQDAAESQDSSGQHQ